MRRQQRARFDGQGVSYGAIKRVMKEVAWVPYTFAIEVAGNTPPKMISLERAVRSK